MRTKFFLALIVFSSLTLWAADNITPLNVKEGLWEMTVTHSMSGMPAIPNIPPDVLAKMPAGAARPRRSRDEGRAEHRRPQRMHHERET